MKNENLGKFDGDIFIAKLALVCLRGDMLINSAERPRCFDNVFENQFRRV